MDRPLSDNKWHEVVITRPTLHRHLLVVDGNSVSLDLSQESVHLDLSGALFVGGVDKVGEREKARIWGVGDGWMDGWT